MIILDIEKPKKCGECPMHVNSNDYCKLSHKFASFVRAEGCPIRTLDGVFDNIKSEIENYDYFILCANGQKGIHIDENFGEDGSCRLV